MPIYNDGLFEVFEIIEDDSVQANTSLQSKDISMTYQELGISDRLRSDLDSHDIDSELPRLTLRLEVGASCFNHYSL